MKSIELKQRVALFALSKGEGRPTAETLASAARQCGMDAIVKRAERGYGTRIVGGSSKLPDDIFIEWNGRRYGSGSGNGKTHSFATESLKAFAEDVVDSLSKDDWKELAIEYHKEQLRLLGS